MAPFRALLLAALVLVGCTKSTGEYLSDLDAISPDRGDLTTFEDASLIFDEGQLGHEAFAGLVTADEMTLPQAIRTLSHATKFLGLARDNTLLQSDAAVAIGHMVTRIPVPPVASELKKLESGQEAYDHFTELLKAREPMEIAGAIDRLNSSDAVVVSEALQLLRSKTDQNFGRDIEAWRGWYETRKADFHAEFIRLSRGPLEILGGYRYQNASQARAVLRVLSAWLLKYFDPELRDVAVPAAMKVGRQAAVYALSEALIGARDPQVRADVADAMAAITDVTFQVPLARRLEREKDPRTATRIIKALRWYPSRRTILAILTAMATLDDTRVDIVGSEVLNALTGAGLEGDIELWTSWWKDKGHDQWP